MAPKSGRAAEYWDRAVRALREADGYLDGIKQFEPEEFDRHVRAGQAYATLAFAYLIASAREEDEDGA